MIYWNEYLESHPGAKWAVIVLFAIFVWFMILDPVSQLGTYDPKKDPPKILLFLKLIVGCIPLVWVGYVYYQATKQPPPPPPPKPEFDWEGFEAKIDSLKQKITNPQVVYLPYPSTAIPAE
jgi:hypothetical protein